MSDLNPRRLPPKAATAAFLDAKIEFLVDAHVWPGRQLLNAAGWMSNFTEAERPFAHNLLNVFMYYNDQLVDALFVGASRQLSAVVTAHTRDTQYARTQWERFLSGTVITYVPGERPNITDSGILFARKARQVLGIRENQIKDPAAAVKALCSGATRHVLLVDDFIGSGQQVAVAWHRRYSVGICQRKSFNAAQSAGANIYYAPLIATRTGLDKIGTDCPGLRVLPGHVLTDEYCLTAAGSALWPSNLKAQAWRFLRDASARAGIVDALGSEWDGFGNLALPLAFHHGVPDATLPLYYWEQRGWTPLVRRR